jgi:hypothetical protein
VAMAWSEEGCAMGLRSLFSRSSDLEPGDTVEVLDDSGDTVETTRRGARASMQVVASS